MIKGIRPTLAQAGAIKIGKLGAKRIAKESKREYRLPEKLDHFWVAKNTRDQEGLLEEDGPIMKELIANHSDSDGKCRAIPICLHSSDIDTVFPTVYAAYATSQIACRGDGEKGMRWQFKNKVKTGETFAVECGEKCKWLQDKNCKPHGTLNCSIALPEHAIAGAVFKWRTTGIISIQRMIGSLEQILDTVGTLVNVPLVLCMQPVQVSPDGSTRTVYSCHVELRAADLLSVQRKALEAMETRQRLAPPTIRLLPSAPAGDDETPEEQAEVADEFFPEVEVVEQVKPNQNAEKKVKETTAKTAAAKEKPKSKPKEKPAEKAKEKPKEKPKQEAKPPVADEKTAAEGLHSEAGPTEENPPPPDDEDVDYGGPDDGDEAF